MIPIRLLRTRSFPAIMAGVVALLVIANGSAPARQTTRPMTFMDIMEMRSVSSPAVSPDGAWLLHTTSVPDWKAGKSYTDLYLVSIERGYSSERQMTFTKEKNESSPQWAPTGGFFAFLSNREAPAARANQNQVYVMRPDGGEARNISEAKEGVVNYSFSKDGKWIAFLSGKEDERQLWIFGTGTLDAEKPKQLTKRSAPVTWWKFSEDSKRIYFLSPDTVDKANTERREKKFDVRVRNEGTPPSHLWFIDLETRTEARLTGSADYSVSSVVLSPDSRWIGFRGLSPNRYLRTITEANTYSDLYLLEVSTGHIERLTENGEIGESPLSFSPTGAMVAFSAPNNFEYGLDNKIYVRPTAGRGGTWKKLGEGADRSLSVGFWSKDGKTIYFNGGTEATVQAFAVSVDNGTVRQISRERGVTFVSEDDVTGTLLINHSDPRTPSNIY
ncbi:MAG: hypothetical protein WD295_03030, partial [Bacteroidota bacterium]